MITESLMAFIGMVSLLVISPGPNTFLILKNVPFYGKKKGLLNVLGIVSAICIHGLFAILGVSSILMTSATLFSLLKLVGAIYLCFIGINTILKSYQGDSHDTQRKNDPIPDSKTIFNNGFTEGLFTNLLNPKPALFYIAIFSQFFRSEASFIEIYFLVLIHGLIALLWYSFIVIGVQQIKGIFLSKGVISKYFQRVSGAVFIYFGYRLATSHQ